MSEKKLTQSTWVCECCGTRTTIRISQGRPHGGSCGRQPRDEKGRYKPHVWVKVKDY